MKWSEADENRRVELIERACKAVCGMHPNAAHKARVKAADLIGEAWLRAEDKASRNFTEVPAEKLALVAASEALTAAGRFDFHSIGGTCEEKVSCFEVRNHCQPFTVRRPTEDASIIHEAIKELPKDDIDRLILAALSQGFRARDAAKAAGISSAAISQRLSKMRSRLSA